MSCFQRSGHIYTSGISRVVLTNACICISISFHRLHACTHKRMHARTHARTYACMHAHTHARMHACMRAPTHSYALTLTLKHTHPHTHTHTQMHARTHAHTHYDLMLSVLCALPRASCIIIKFNVLFFIQIITAIY